MDWRQEKQLRDCSKFENGWTLFVEDGDPKQPFDTFKWKQEFNAELERVTLLVNDPKSDPDAMYYGKKISTQKNATIGELKLKIALELDLPIDSFFLVKAGTDKEIKEMQRTVDQTGLSHNSMVKVKLGTPKNEGFYDIHISIIKLRNHLPDAEIIDKTPICTI